MNHIKELDSTVGETVTRQLLKRYYTILEMDNGQEKHAELNELTKELKSKLNQIDNKRIHKDAGAVVSDAG